ncbi:MAG: Gfo/Idh/MocA family oxidoreductase [Candidatus Eremiobacteraeota bacterium]|nr:Gfo/Idh/MocA family oxidoreductase [Candidatus Eremiobacteraeota bacterium]
MPVGIAVVGCGYWGPNLVRNFWESDETELRWVCDLVPERLQNIRKRYPAVQLTHRLDDVLADPQVEGVCIATPSHTHYELARQVLESGRHVLVEKPLCDDSEKVQRLIDLAEQRGKVLMVDHTFLYNPAVQAVRGLLDSGRLGRLLYFDSTRVNLGLFQRDVNVLWDLAVHDLAMMDYLIHDRKPLAISATGIAHVPGQPENMAYMTCFYEDNLVAHIHANWLAPVKLRRTLLGGEKQMIVYDDLEPSERVKVYDKGITVTDEKEIHKLLISYRSGDCWCPKVPAGEALENEVKHFAECIRTGAKPLSDGMAGLRVVKMIEAGSLSIQQRGAPVELNLP